MVRLETAGFYGKLPSYSDFVKRRVTNSWVNTIDRWFREGLSLLHETRGEDWEKDYRIAPAWRYIVSKNVIGADASIGTWCPSYDRVGRLFPLVTQQIVHDELFLNASVNDIDFYLAEVETLAFAARDTRMNIDEFDSQLQHMEVVMSGNSPSTPSTRQFVNATFNSDAGVAEPLATLFIQQLVRGNRHFSLWWSHGTVELQPRLYVLDGFPTASQLSQFIPAVASMVESS